MAKLVPLCLLVVVIASSLTFAVTDPVRAAFPGSNGKIAFATNRDLGDWEIYVMNADGTGQTRLTNIPGDEMFPDWQPLLGGPPVGGIAQLPTFPDSSGPTHLRLVGLAAFALLPLVAGTWYARRRWLRRKA